MAAALEKDAELDRRIAALRRKNEALVRRYQEIEADRRAAELQGGAVTARPPRGGQRHPQSDPRPPPKEPKPPQGPPRTPGRPPGGGGAGGGSRPRRPRGRGGGAGGGDGSDRKSQEWEQRRLQNIEQMNEEMQKIAEYERSCRDGFPDPSPNPVRNFLDDPRRRGPERGRGPGGGSRRRGRNWGGAELSKATARRGGLAAPLDPTLWMTGRERAEYERWKRERERIDRERLQRHRHPSGSWRREWDAQKPPALFSGLPEDPEGGGGAPPAPPRGQLRPLPHPQRRRRGRAGGGGAYSFHDDRWEPQPESPEVPGKVPEAAPGAPGSPGDSDQWEDVSEEEEEEPGDPPGPPPPAPPPPEGGVPEPPLPPPEPSGTPPDAAPGVEISDFQREEPATPPRCDGGGTPNPT